MRENGGQCLVWKSSTLNDRSRHYVVRDLLRSIVSRQTARTITDQSCANFQDSSNLAPRPTLLERPPIGSSSDRCVTEILEGLRADPTRTPSLDELAELAGMSHRSLSRYIRSRTGGNLGQWLKQVRLSRAQEMLTSGVYGIEDVALRSGFPDAHALRAAFRAELGLTPTQWMARQKVG
ncbi:AraC family transcriptional regulator [Tardiphaga sp. 37S4]|uniref:helix-turn-helix domain-containing protein n=1 Tax=Tardiphaga sp. 37S4 TaxID=1404741 RepID=UPI001E329B53|nr:AraC family transcriptional regulator [Tardiphaga sp. 37S4]UFS76274.1 AraC family transcriptional regulator [Tardiphaga sp. 37S4]